MSKAALNVRCPDKGHLLVAVTYEGGRALATVRTATGQVLHDEGQSRIFQSVTEMGPIDLAAITDAGLVVDAACACGRRYVDLVWLREQLRNGARGKILATAPLRPYDGG